MLLLIEDLLMLVSLEHRVFIAGLGFIQPARFGALWASRRASAQAVTSKWQLRATSPMNTSSSAGENGFSAKNGS